MEDDPEIEIFDISRYAGMGHYANHSSGYLAPLNRRRAAEPGISEKERDHCLREAAAQEALAQKYWLADRIMDEVEHALAEEDACPSS